MRNTDPIIWPGTDASLSLKRKMQANYDNSITNLQVQWNQADLDQRAYLGDPEVWNMLYPVGTMRRRKMFTFNLIHSTIQMVSGHQRRNRKATIAIPVQSPVQKTADQISKCLYYVHGSGQYQVYSDASGFLLTYYKAKPLNRLRVRSSLSSKGVNACIKQYKKHGWY